MGQLGSQCKRGGAGGKWRPRTCAVHLLSRNETEIAALSYGTLQRDLEIDDLDLVLDEGPSSLTVLPAPLRVPEFDAILFP